MTFSKKEKEANYCRNPNLWGLRTTALTSKTGFQAQRQLWSPQKKPHSSTKTADYQKLCLRHSAFWHKFISKIPWHAKQAIYLSFKPCVQKGARVENLSMPGDVFSLKKPALCSYHSQSILLSPPLSHYSYSVKLTCELLSKVPCKGPTRTLPHLASGMATEPHYLYWIWNWNAPYCELSRKEE